MCDFYFGFVKINHSYMYYNNISRPSADKLIQWSGWTVTKNLVLCIMCVCFECIAFIFLKIKPAIFLLKMQAICTRPDKSNVKIHSTPASHTCCCCKYNRRMEQNLTEKYQGNACRTPHRNISVLFIDAYTILIQTYTEQTWMPVSIFYYRTKYFMIL